MLVLEIRPGESLWVRGIPPIEFQTKARIALSTTVPVSFLFGKQIMPAETATTILRKLYYAIQMVYVGPQDEVDRWGKQVDELCEHPPYRDQLSQVRERLSEHKFYLALKLVRALIRREEE